MAGADGTTWATLIPQAGTGIRVALGAEVLDIERQELVDQGWGTGLAAVPAVVGWSVLIRGGRFIGIRRPCGSGDYWNCA